MLLIKKKDVTTNPYFPFQSTGRGKSTDAQTLSTVINGSAITFENTKSLSSDQLSKVVLACQVMV